MQQNMRRTKSLLSSGPLLSGTTRTCAVPQNGLMLLPLEHLQGLAAQAHQIRDFGTDTSDDIFQMMAPF